MRIEHLRKIDADGFRDQREYADEECELEPVVRVPGRELEFFRMDHGHYEVADEKQGDDADDDDFHRGVGSKGVAEAGIERPE